MTNTELARDIITRCWSDQAACIAAVLDERDTHIESLRVAYRHYERIAARLRTALMDVLRACGGQVTPDVSDDFLCFAPDEVRKAIAAFRFDEAMAASKGPEAIRRKIRAFADLKPGWDSYDGKPITPAAIEAAIKFLEAVQPVPCSDGGIRLEWPKLVIEFGPNGDRFIQTACDLKRDQ